MMGVMGVSVGKPKCTAGRRAARTERANLEDGNHCPELVARRIVEGGFEVGLFTAKRWVSVVVGRLSARVRSARIR